MNLELPQNIIQTVDNMNVKEKLLKLKNNLPKSKSILPVLLAILGLFLILVSGFSEKSKKENKDTENAGFIEKSRTDEYTALLESRLENVLSDMLSNSKVSVMITLESGIEYVYADELKTGAEIKTDKESFKEEQSDTNQNNYVIYKDSKGNEQALLVTEIMPKIKGVVVVCDGGQNENVSVAVKTAVSKALAIDNEKICVIGRN